MEALRFIDGDSHVLEPESIWENYLEKKYRNLVSGHVRWVTAPSGNGINAVDETSTRETALAFELEVEVMGTYPLGVRDTDAATRSFQDRDLDELDVAYGKWADQDFPASAYREVMDVHGVDHMILYPDCRVLDHRCCGDGRRDCHGHPAGLQSLARRLLRRNWPGCLRCGVHRPAGPRAGRRGGSSVR